MKKVLTFSVAIVLLATTVLTSCGKYPEGPNFALSTKKSRFAGEWKATSINQNGVEWNLTNLAQVNSINKDGSYTSQTPVTVLGIPSVYTSQGKWEFTSDKSSVVFTESTPTANAKDTFVILKLEKKALKFKQTDYSSGDVFIYTYDLK
jgi:hypothetical protein